MTRTRTLIASLGAAALAAAAFASALPAAPTCSITWDGGAGTLVWSHADNWTGNTLPGTSDHVCIPALAGPGLVADMSATVKSVTAQHPLQINATLELTSTAAGEESSFTDVVLLGGLAGDATATVSGTLDWSGGSMSGAGRTVSTGTLNISPGAWSTAYLGAGRTLRTEGLGTWATGYLQGGAGAVWEQAGTFDAGGETGHMYNGDAGDPALLKNTGTITKTTGTGGSLIALAVDNDGAIDPDSGELQLSNGTGSTGRFGGAPGTSVGIVSGGRFEMHTGATFDNVVVRDGTLAVPAGHHAAGADLELQSGRLAGGGTIETTGTLRWTGGGTMEEGGTTLVSPTGEAVLDFGPWSTAYLGAGRTLRNEGGGRWLNGYLQGGPGAVWEQAGTGFDARGETGYWYSADGSSPALLHVQPGGGVVRTTATGTSRIDFALDNDGTTRVDSGVLEFRAGSGAATSTGDFGGTGDGRTSLAGGDFVIGDAAFSGVRVTDAAHVAVAPSATWSGTDMDVDGGYLEGAGTVVASGTLRWRGGHMAGTGTTDVTGALEIDPGVWGTLYLDRGRTLRAAGTGAWTGGYLSAADDAALVVSGQFDARGETGYWYWTEDPDPGAQPRLHVLASGTLTKTQGGGESRIDLALENDGATAAETGRLAFHRGGSGLSTGDLGGSGGGRAVLAGGTFPIGGGSFSGGMIDGGSAAVAAGAQWAGSDLVLASGALAGTGTVTAAGTLSWRGGRMQDAGTTRVTGALEIDPPVYGTVHLDRGRTLRTEGTGFWSEGYIEAADDAAWEHSGSFDARSETGYAYWSDDPDPGARPRVHVLAGGTMTKTAGTGETRLDLALEFDGRVTGESGVLGWRGGGAGVSTGDLGGSGSGTAALITGDWAVGDAGFSGGTVDGGAVEVQAGAEWSGSDLSLSAGSIGGPGAVTVAGTLRWRGGGMLGSGTTTVDGALEIDGAPYGTVSLGVGRTLRTQGTGAWRDGYIAAAPDSVWENSGDVDLRSETGYLYADACCTGADPRLRNTGTLRRTAGAGTTTIAAFLELAGGTIAQESGVLAFTGGGDISSQSAGGTFAGGEFTLRDGTQLTGAVLSGGEFLVPDGATATLSGGALDGGAVRGDGDLQLAGAVRWGGANASGDGDTFVLPGATLELSGFLTLGRDMHSRGEVVHASGWVSQAAGSAFHNRGTLRIADGTSGWYGNPTGSLPRQLVNTGLIVREGTGTTTMPGVENDGVIRVPRGELSFGDFLQTSDGRTEIELGGTAPGTQHGRVSSGSELRLSGTLALTLTPGYAPASGEEFHVVSGWPRNGEFSSITGLDYPGPGELTPSYDTSGLILTVSGAAAKEPAPPQPAEGTAEPDAPAPALVAVDDRLVLQPGRAVRLLANDTVVEGTRVRLVTRPRRVRIALDRRTGILRVRLGRSRARVVRLRYRLVAPDGSRSGVASVRLRIARRSSS